MVLNLSDVKCSTTGQWPSHCSLTTVDKFHTDRLLSLPVGHFHSHSPSPFVIIARAEDWYSVYSPVVGRRLLQPRQCSKCVHPLPKAVCQNGSRDKHNCLWWNSIVGFLISHSTVRLAIIRPLWPVGGDVVNDHICLLLCWQYVTLSVVNQPAGSITGRWTLPICSP